MNNKLIKLGSFVLIFAMLILGTMGCRKTSNDNTNLQNETNNSGQTDLAVQPRIIKVGTGSTFKPYAFIDENGELAGFEVDFLNELDSRLDNIEFEYEAMDLTNLVLSLESGKVDMISYQLGRNEEREEKFVFPTNSYINSGVKVTVKTDNQDIVSLEELKGKTLSISPAEISNDIINRFNENNKDNPIKVVYRDGNTDGVVLVATGKVDATLAQPSQVQVKQEEAGMDVKTVGELLEKIPVYQLFRKDDSLKDVTSEIDSEIKAMQEDGTLSELSIKWLKEDYTK